MCAHVPECAHLVFFTFVMVEDYRGAWGSWSRREADNIPSNGVRKSSIGGRRQGDSVREVRAGCEKSCRS